MCVYHTGLLCVLGWLSRDMSVLTLAPIKLFNACLQPFCLLLSSSFTSVTHYFSIFSYFLAFVPPCPPTSRLHYCLIPSLLFHHSSSSLSSSKHICTWENYLSEEAQCIYFNVFSWPDTLFQILFWSTERLHWQSVIYPTNYRSDGTVWRAACRSQ